MEGSSALMAQVDHGAVVMTETAIVAETAISDEESYRMAAIAAAKARGYVGDPCPECGNLTMVRNGTCLKCDTCGATTGCS